MRLMPAYIFSLLALGWIAWMIPFFLARRGGKAQTLDRRARWGIFIQGIGFAILWMNNYWVRSPSIPRIIAAACLLTLGAVLSWTSARTLGRQWRFDAGLNADHELVQSGAYRFVRHPIYASMLCMLLGTGFLITPLWALFLALIFFLIGLEIRVRIEDALLESRFGDSFRDYQRRVPAYLPFVR
jgi:protein-S-isoprenylcysteine O-methyltransferase Ste14